MWAIGVSGPFSPCKQETPTATLPGGPPGLDGGTPRFTPGGIQADPWPQPVPQARVRVGTGGGKVFSLPFLPLQRLQI